MLDDRVATASKLITRVVSTPLWWVSTPVIWVSTSTGTCSPASGPDPMVLELLVRLAIPTTELTGPSNVTRAER